MLFFIRRRITYGYIPGAFKYISCYSLSIAGVRVSTIHKYLNTSHVILYLQYGIDRAELLPFKYISCYSLSENYANIVCYIDI